jgi:hypothetical protein
MKEQYSMKEMFIPSNNSPCNIFISQDWNTNKEKAIVVIQGAGKVRAGQFARSVCINDGLEEGTVFRVLEFAREEGYSVIVLNPNFVKDHLTNKPIKGMETPEKHCSLVWKNTIVKSPAKKLFILAHSCGGIRTLELLNKNFEDFKKRVKAIALTDSVHTSISSLSPQARSLLYSLSINWIRSSKPLDTPIRSPALSRR